MTFLCLFDLSNCFYNPFHDIQIDTCCVYHAWPVGQKELGNHLRTYWRSLKLLDSSKLDLLILKNDLVLIRVRHEYYCLGAA